MTDIEKIVLAHRYLYYVESQPVISDYEYDVLERKAREVAAPDSKVHLVGSSLPSDYPEEIKRYALSMLG